MLPKILAPKNETEPNVMEPKNNSGVNYLMFKVLEECGLQKVFGSKK